MRMLLWDVTGVLEVLCVKESEECYARRLIIESSEMSNTNKALAVLHNSDLFSMTPPLPSYDTVLYERGTTS